MGGGDERQIPAALRSRWAAPLVSLLERTGPMRFNAIKRELAGISSKTLSLTLRSMRAARIVGQSRDESPGREGSYYSLTEKGIELARLLAALFAWKKKWD